MSMLAEMKTRSSWVLNPRASDWSKDQNKLGQKMLEKMGWSAGKGLGAREQGSVEAIRIKHKADSRGLGAGRKKEQEDWLQQQERFQSFLDGLNGTNDRSVTVKSLEDKSKTTRTKIHYHKFARGKDISRYSQKDLSCIVGSGFVPIKLPETEILTTEGNIVAITLNNGGNSCVGPDTDDHCPSSEESMNRGRSRTGRELKPSAKVVAQLEGAPSPPKKKKIKKKAAKIDSISPSRSSNLLNTEPRLDKHSRKGGELKSTSPRLEQLPSLPKKNKLKGKGSEPSPPVDSGASTNDPSSDHKDREHSRSGRAYKPTSKITDGFDMSPSPKKKKPRDKSTEQLPETESYSESTSQPATTLERSTRRKKTKDKSAKLQPETESDFKPSSTPGKRSVLSKSEREHQPSVEVLTSLNKESSSPKKRKNKNTTSEAVRENESCSESAIPENNMVRSRSRREHKPSAKALASWEVENPSPKKKKKKNKETLTEVENNVPGDASSSKMPVVSRTVDPVHSRCGREYKRSAKVKASLEETSPYPSKTSKINILTEDDDSVKHVGKKKRERIQSECSSSTVVTSKRKALKDEEADTSKKKVATHGAEISIGSKSSRKRLPPSESLSEISVGAERMKSKKSKDNVVSSKKMENHNPALDHSGDEEHSPKKKRLKGKNKEVVSVDAQTLKEESPKLGKKKKGKRAEESALNDQPESSNAVTHASASERLHMKWKSNGDKVENCVADDEQNAELLEEEPKPRRKMKGEVADGLDESSKNKTDNQESKSKGLKKGKNKKAKNLDPKILEAGANEEDGSVTTDLPSKTSKRKKKDKDVDKPEAKEKIPKVVESRGNKDISVGKVDRQKSSDSQETAASKGQDSEENSEELASINSQSSLIYEMIGTAPNTLKVCSEPEDLKKYHILASGDEDENQA